MKCIERLGKSQFSLDEALDLPRFRGGVRVWDQAIE